MRKSICAAALLLSCTGLVHAQSSVTLYGLIDSGITYLNNSGGHAATLAQSGLWLGSRFGLRGTEDLGAGSQSFFVLENGFDVDSGKLGQNGRMFGRQAFVGVRNVNWGTLTLGRQYDFAQYELNGPLQLGRVFGPVNDLDNAGNSWRLNNAIRYDTPNYAGFTGGAMISLGGQPGSIMKQSTWSTGGNYDRGPLFVGVAYTEVHDPATTWYDGGVTAANNAIWGAYANAASRLRIAGVGVTYRFTALTLNGGITDNTFIDGFRNRNVRFDNYYLSAQYRVAPALTLKAYTYFTTSKQSASGHGPNYQQANLVAVYDFSKRTSVYGVVAYQHATGGAVAQINGESPSSTSSQVALHVGLLTRF